MTKTYYYIIFFSLFLLIALIPASVTASKLLSTGCGGEIISPSNLAYEQQVVELVNQARQESGLPPLKLVNPLAYSARYHAADMSLDDYFNHDTYDRQEGNLQYVCNTWERIGAYYTGARGENIAWGYSTPADVMDAWLNSPGHRANILSSDSWEIGVGYDASSGAAIWVQNFGHSPNTYPLVINGEAAGTPIRQVSLYIYGNWQEMRLRNDSGDWSAWMPFYNELSWSLTSGAGEHTVTVELRSGVSTATSSDTIFLEDEMPPYQPPGDWNLLFLPLLKR